MGGRAEVGGEGTEAAAPGGRGAKHESREESEEKDDSRAELWCFRGTPPPRDAAVIPAAKEPIEDTEDTEEVDAECLWC
jgi:hypothetical protein